MTSLMFWNVFVVSRELLDGDETHWNEQTAVVRRHAPDILCITEGWEWDRDDRALFERAKRDFGYAHGVLYVSKTGCHMATFWNEPIELVDERHQPHAEAWWHGFYRVVLSVPGQPAPVTVVGTHLNPYDLTLRRMEASWLWPELRATASGVLVMDANTVAPGDPEPAFGLSTHLPGCELADRGALETLAAAGLIDVGAAFEDRGPTTGYFAADKEGAVRRTMRLDQAWATPSLRVSRYEVVRDPETETASDHRPIQIEF